MLINIKMTKMRVRELTVGMTLDDGRVVKRITTMYDDKTSTQDVVVLTYSDDTEDTRWAATEVTVFDRSPAVTKRQVTIKVRRTNHADEGGNKYAAHVTMWEGDQCINTGNSFYTVFDAVLCVAGIALGARTMGAVVAVDSEFEDKESE